MYALHQAVRRLSWIVSMAGLSIAAGCNGEVEIRYVSVEGYEPGVKYYSEKNGYRLHGVVGSAGEITIEYKGEVIAHETGLKPGEEFEMFVDDPLVVQVPVGTSISVALARSEDTGIVYPLELYDLGDFVPNLDGDYVAEPGMELIVIGYELDNTPDGDYTIELTFSGLAPGQHEIKWILAGLVETADAMALFPVEPVTYDFAQIQNWPYAYSIHVVTPEVDFLDASAAKPDPQLWQYARIELEGADPSDVDPWSISATHDVAGGNTFWADYSYQEWEDSDGDGISELVVRFSRSALEAGLPSGMNRLLLDGNLWTPMWNGWQASEWLALDPPVLDVDILAPEQTLEPGGSLDWTFDVRVPGTNMVTTDFWYEIRLPDESTFIWPQFSGIMLTPSFQYLGPWGITLLAIVPLGTYRFETVFGDYLTGEVYGADGFGAIAPSH